MKNSENKQKKYKIVTAVCIGNVVASVLIGIAIFEFTLGIFLCMPSSDNVAELNRWATVSRFFTDIGGITIVLSIGLLISVMILWWSEWCVHQVCDFEIYRVFIERLLKRRIRKKNARLHLNLFTACLILGRYEECQTEIDEIKRLQNRLSKKNRIIFRLFYVNYLCWTQDSGSPNEELKEISEMLQSLEKIKADERKELENNVLFYGYLSEGNWEEVVSLWEKRKCVTVYEQVCRAYYLGKGYYQMTDYEAAYSHLTFAAAWGGNTKYVSLAKEMLSAMPEKEEQGGAFEEEPMCRKYWTQKRLRICLVGIVAVFVAALLMFYGKNITGGSIEEVYCREYWTAKESEVALLYREAVNGYELAILCDGNKISYCLCKKTEKNSGESYKIIYSFRTDQHIKTTMWEKAILQMLNDESGRESYYQGEQNTFVEMQMWTVLKELYMKNSSVYPDDFSYTGVSCYPDMEDYVIEGQQVEVEPVITINGTQFYIWHIEGIDLDSLDFLTFID